MSKKPNKKRDEVAQSLITNFLDIKNVLNLRKTMARIAKKSGVSESYVAHVWYHYVAPYNKKTKKAKQKDNAFCFATVANDGKYVENRKTDTHNVGYESE